MPTLYQGICLCMLATILLLQIWQLVKQHKHDKETRRCKTGTP